MLKLDYTLQTPEERNELVKKIVEENGDNLSDTYLEYLADYLILAMEKQERKERELLTENRMSTINKRETSLEGLMSQFENGEDGFYGLVTENDKNTIFRPKVSITKKDIEEIPELQQVREAIQMWEEKLKTAEGKDKYIIKKAIIELRRDQYLIKDAYRKPVILKDICHQKSQIPLDDSYSINEQGEIIPSGVSLINPKVVSAILCNYPILKQHSQGNFESDLWYLIEDFNAICTEALSEYPLYQKITECKIDGMQNAEIQEIIKNEFDLKHSVEYISSLWRNKIPKIIASCAEDKLLNWHYLEVEKGKFKRCSRCGQYKLAHNKYFSKNRSSKDSFYSLCKECRNAKGGKK